jgi:hypothetical protein
MCLKPAAGKGLLVRLLNPTAGEVAIGLELGGLPDGSFVASRMKLDETTTISSADLGRRKRLELMFRPFEMQTWNIAPC